MPRINGGCWFFGLVAMLWAGRAPAGADPTPAEIVAGWKAMSGGLEGKVVYWDGSAIKVLDLGTGTRTSLLSVPNEYGEPSMTPYPVWSPDGTKISYHRVKPSRSFWVMNADGSNPRKVVSGINWDYGAHSWWTSNGGAGDWIVAQKGQKIVRVQVNADNTPGSTVKVLDTAKNVDWLSMSGDYVGFTEWGGHGKAGNKCVAINWKTGQENDTVPRTDDACSMHLKPDGSGTSVFCHGSHWNCTFQTFDGKTFAKWKPLPGGIIEMLRWSNHPDFICHMDNRQKRNRAKQRAWIRKVNSNGRPHLFLGYGMWGPDLRVKMRRAPKPKPAKAAPKKPLAAKPAEPTPEKEASKMLSLATQMLRHRQFARENRAVIEARLRQVIRTYPDTDAARRAQELLDEGW